MPRTNNSIERFFRKMRRNVRKRYGNMATGKALTEKGTLLRSIKIWAIKSI
ncbi:MAG: hypothetical protein QXQ25_00395 [Thermoplasmata archaeon]